jgi:hypothetical protein
MFLKILVSSAGKAKNYVLDNPLLEWIEDFLTGRTQRISINGSTSDWKEVTSGMTFLI